MTFSFQKIDLMSFEEAITRLKRRTEGCELNILVWGPGPSGGNEHFAKRQKIKQEIIQCFRHADVRFSEELDLSKTLPGIDQRDLGLTELLHLAACDVCVVLDASKGAGEEIAHFVRSPDAYKLLILTHERYASGTSFPAALRQHQNQLFYDDHQYATCTLVEHVLTRITIVAFAKVNGYRV
jgi:hypothetical protein